MHVHKLLSANSRIGIVIDEKMKINIIIIIIIIIVTAVCRGNFFFFSFCK